MKALVKEKVLNEEDTAAKLGVDINTFT